ncbi:MAG: hypothetical protein KBB86_01770 [Candidatus Pacebacteria bacterium]|nr:hypothetical protein [Candidatus Paceibacterota bacterium]
MNTKNRLLKALGNYEVRNFLERYDKFHTLLAQLQTEQRSEKFIATMMLLASLRAAEPKEFEALVASYETTALKDKANLLVKLLTYLLKFFPGLDYTINGENVTAKEIANTISQSLLAGNSVSYEFSIDTYRISIEMGLEKSEYASPFCYVNLYNNEELKERLTFSTSTSWSKIFKLDRKQNCLKLLLQILGDEGMKPGWGSNDKLSVLGHIITDKSATEGKQVPVWFDKRRREIRSYVNSGNVPSLKKLLQQEYAKQKANILPNAMQLLHNFGADLLKDCERIKKLIDPRISLLDKIHLNVAKGCFDIAVIPRTKGVSANERKTFLLAFRNEYQVELITKVLSQAGWAGSLLVASLNFPSIHEILDTKQADYVMQSELGHSHEKDLYDEELKGRTDNKDLKGKILQCHISRDEDIKRYAEDFTQDKIEQFCLTSLKLQEA